MIWYDYAVIKVGHLFESINKIGLFKRLDASVRIWVNTGTVNVAVGQPNNTNLNYSLTTANNTFSNTCPLMISWLGDTHVNGGVPGNVQGIVAGLYINKPPTTRRFLVRTCVPRSCHGGERHQNGNDARIIQ